MLLKNNYKLIKDEALFLYNNKNKLLNMKDLSNIDFGIIDSEENLWKVYVLKWYDKISDKARKECPNTCNLIDQCDDVHIAMFSILEPGNFIPPHKGPSTLCLRYHLGLSIPQDKNNCFITVNNEKFIWEEGKSFIFDDTYEHSVINNTNEPRIILFVDIKRPTNFLTSNLNNWLLSKSNFNHFTKTINDAVEKKQSIIKETFII
jgi:beta-hydroxylase